MVEPFVVSVVPTYQEERHIERCLRSLIEQSWPASQHLIQVIEGGSTDSTRQIVEKMAVESANSDGPAIELLDNPKRFVADARNISLANLPEAATHVFEIIGHVWVPSDHIELRMADLRELQIELGEETKIGGIGTLVKESDENLGVIGRWIEATLQNPLASGRGQFAQFRGRQRTLVPPFTLYSRAALEAVGGWDEKFLTTQDSDLNFRLESAGWQMWRSDASYCRMAKRTSFTGWLKFGHRYGFWRTKHLLRSPARASPLEFAPWLGLMVTIALFYSGMGVEGIPLWNVPPAVYAFTLTIHGMLEAVTRKQFSLLFGIPIMLILLHTTFSIGLVDGLVRKGRAAKDRVA